MKMRTINHLTGAACVIANILALIAVLTGMHTLFGIVAVSLSLAVSLGMYLRIVVGMAALQVAEKQEALVPIAIAQKNSPDVVTEFANWIRDGDLDFKGAKICDLMEAKDDDGQRAGYWILLVGTKRILENIRRELTKGTVLDYWPIDRGNWAQNYLQNYIPAYIDEEEDDTIPELKG